MYKYIHIYPHIHIYKYTRTNTHTHTQHRRGVKDISRDGQRLEPKDTRSTLRRPSHTLKFVCLAISSLSVGAPFRGKFSNKKNNLVGVLHREYIVNTWFIDSK